METDNKKVNSNTTLVKVKWLFEIKERTINHSFKYNSC